MVCMAFETSKPSSKTLPPARPLPPHPVPPTEDQVLVKYWSNAQDYWGTSHLNHIGNVLLILTGVGLLPSALFSGEQPSGQT